jgi:hypothetical protein
VPELPLQDDRAWVEFVDPAEAAQVVRADVTWLTSRWTCIYGSGCHGIDRAVPWAGCCSLGAHFADADDERRVLAAAGTLTDEDWQLRARGLADVVVTDEEGARRTRVVDGACIFHNRPGFAGGSGCALHRLAVRTGASVVATKPDVCWQLPIRRTYRDVVRPDGTEALEITISEYDRRGWGPGGRDLHWYCTTDPAAHVGGHRVVDACREELTELLGEPAYRRLVELCDAAPLTSGPLEHVATAAARRRSVGGAS